MGWFKTYIDVIGSVTTLAGGLLTLLSSMPEKKHKWLAFTGGALALVGGLLTFLASQSSSHSVAAFQQKVLKNDTDINAQVSDASTKLKDLQDNLGDEKKAVRDLTGTVRSGTKQVLGATKQVTNAVTGGKAYCYVVILPDMVDNKPNMLKVYLLNPGSTPVYDVSYTIMKALPPKPSIDLIQQYYRTQQSGFAPVVFGGPGNGLLNPTPLEVLPGEYGVHIYMRNGHISEVLRMDFDGKKWIAATVVKRDGKTLQSYDPQDLTVPY